MSPKGKYMHKQVIIGNWRKSCGGKRGNVLPFQPGILRYVFRDGVIAIALAKATAPETRKER